MATLLLVAGACGDNESSKENGDAGTVRSDSGEGPSDAALDRATVCTDGSADFRTIQEAIDRLADGGVIEVCPGTYLENLVIDRRPLTLRPYPGAAAPTIDGAATGRVITVTDVDDPGVVIESVVLVNGLTGEDGGGLYCRNSTLTLNGSQISLSGGNNGGGFAARDCVIDARDNALFLNTAAARGGGAFISTSKGSFANNESHSNQAQEGGGIAVVSAGGEEPSQRDFASDALEIRGNTFRDNSAETPRTIFYFGKESGGGGVWLRGDSPFVENLVIGNSSSVNGGGLYVAGGTVTIVDNEVLNNRTIEDGGGIFTNSCGGRIAGNRIIGNSTFDDAGGLRIFVGFNMTIENNNISFNSALDASGGVKLSHARNVFLNNVLEGNVADTAGGLELDNDSSLVSGCTFRANQARLGAGIHSKAAEGEIRIGDCLFDGNVASAYGGALHFEDDAHPVLLENIEARGNRAPRGGAIATNNARLHLTDSLLVGNQADDRGGALYFSGYEEELADEAVSIPIHVTTNEEDPKLVELVRVELYDNRAPLGGAVSAVQDTWLQMSNAVAAENRADDGGGGLFLDSVNGFLSNAVVADNAAPDGAGIRLAGSAGLTVVNTIIADNRKGAGVATDDAPPGVWQYNDVHGNADGDYAGTADLTGGDGNISEPPDFVDADGRDYRLRKKSACIDAGHPGKKYTDPDGTRSDMGVHGGPGAVPGE
jgi:hypothetical protein